MRKKRPGEFELIAKLFAPLAKDPGALGLTDDTAYLRPRAGHDLVLKTDAIVEGVHFLPRDPPMTVAQKALRVNLSDLAAKGARPLGYLMALSIPDRIGLSWLEGFARGLARDQRTFGLSLLGGDTTGTPGPITIAITAIGLVPRGAMIPRSGARPGDLVCVTGTVGDAGAGLALLKRGTTRSKDARRLIARYRTPEPRLALGRLLAPVATASIDVSDGLVADVGHISDVSDVHIEIEAGQVPLSPAFRRLEGHTDAALLHAVTAGDDYEIAFTCRPRAWPDVVARARSVRTLVTRIGLVSKGRGVSLKGRHGRPLAIRRAGFTHF